MSLITRLLTGNNCLRLRALETLGKVSWERRNAENPLARYVIVVKKGKPY